MKNVDDSTKSSVMFFGTMNQNHQLQYNANSDMSLDKTHHILTALRDGLKILWKLGAFCIAKDQVGPSIDKETVGGVHVAFIAAHRNQFMMHQMNLLSLKAVVPNLEVYYPRGVICDSSVGNVTPPTR